MAIRRCRPKFRTIGATIAIGILAVSALSSCGGSTDLGRLLTIARVEEQLPDGTNQPLEGAPVEYEIIGNNNRVALTYSDTTDDEGLSVVYRGSPEIGAEYRFVRVTAQHPRDGRTAEGRRTIEAQFDFQRWFVTFWPAPFSIEKVLNKICSTIIGFPTCNPGSLLSINFVLWGAGVRIVFTPVPEPTPTFTPTVTPTPRPPTVTPTPSPTPEPPTPTPTPTPIPPTSTPTPTPTPGGRTQLISGGVFDIQGCNVRLGADAKAKEDPDKRITRLQIQVDGRTVYDTGPISSRAVSAFVDLRAPTGRHAYEIKVWDNADFAQNPLTHNGDFTTDCTGVSAVIVDKVETAGVTPANRAPQVGPIVAVLNPPITTYTVEASDPDGDQVTYAWSRNAGACGGFSSEGNRAVWSHPHPPCGDETSHPGIVTVVVSDGKGSQVTRTYSGTLSGRGPT